MAMTCTHNVCETCADRLRHHNDMRCPLCRADVLSFEVDHASRQRAGQVPAKCLPEQCGFRGTVHDLLQHKNSSTCQFQTVYCRRGGCSEIVERRSIHQHEEECAYKKVECTCGLKTIQMYIDRHLTECETYPVPCPVGCDAVIERAKVAIHVTQTCQQTVRFCSVTGCGFVGRQAAMEAHNQESADIHTRLLVHDNNMLKVGLATGELKSSDASILYGEVKAITFTINSIQVGLAEGTTAFTSPTFENMFNGKWQVSIQKPGGRDGWHIYLCLISRPAPIHLKVMFLLLSPAMPGADRREDHAICLSGPICMRENKKYGAPLPTEKIIQYSRGNDRLKIKVLLQIVSAVIKP
ncbi:TRAF3 [Branchiostoma lanceolatum]|uniref:TRAF3 protein n=1 Tax=Branchiostoma lanceolatum TaxID=7740 RepID=A0A8S4MNF0_BRALA|nr:TRAF3 [Branchiostoma lanceolatum]